MSHVWSYATEGLDWNELAALYRAAPLGNKNPAALQIAFTNSKEPFYKRCGFRRMRTAMAIFENQALAAERGYIDEA